MGAVLVAGLLGSAAFATGFAGSAAAAYISQGIASAQGVHVTVTSDSIPIFATPVDASEPLAAAAVDARGDSTAQAAYPYGGDTVTYGVTGAAAPNLPAGVAAPAVPANETSSFPATPSAKMDATAYHLDAESTSVSSTSSAASSADATNVPGGALTGSGGTNTAQASVSTVPTTGMVTAASNATAAGLSTGPLVLGQVTSSVTMTRLPGQPPTRTVGMNVGMSSVMGQTVNIGPGGITVPTGSAVAVPDESASINQALSAAGITVSYLSEIDTSDGTVAPGVEVSQMHTDATTGQRTNTTYVFGQASASVTAGGAPDRVFSDAPDAAVTAPATGESQAATPPTTTTAGARKTTAAGVAPASQPPVTTATTPSGGTSGTAIAPMPTDAAGAITAPPATVATPTAATSQTPTRAVNTQTALAAAHERAGDESLAASGVSFYLVLVGAAIALVASSSTLRALGVRLLWTR